jgi:hypothetical protein
MSQTYMRISVRLAQASIRGMLVTITAVEFHPDHGHTKITWTRRA